MEDEICLSGSGGKSPTECLENGLVKEKVDEYRDGERDEEEHFEQVSLNDQEKHVKEIEGKSSSLQLSDSQQEEFFDSSPVIHMSSDTRDYDTMSPGSDKLSHQSWKPSSSSASFDSNYGIYVDSGFSSPIDSPSKHLAKKQTMPNVSPELLYIVDSAIMGNSVSLDKLKHAVHTSEFNTKLEGKDNISRLVVDVLLATMGVVESFDDDHDSTAPTVMLNSRAAIVAGELIPWLPFERDLPGYMSPRTRMVKGLLAILNSCTRNRSMCSSSGLLGVLLGAVERLSTTEVYHSQQIGWDGSPLCLCIQLLAGHTLNVIDLHRWLHLISKTVATEWASLLMLALEKAVSGKESSGPACTFEFDGENSGLLGPGDSRWPFSNGFAFVTWIYVESFADTLNTATAAAAIAAAAAAKSGKSSPMSAAAAASALAGEGTTHMPRLFSFLSSDNQGIEAYFHGQFLVIESGSGKGKKSSLHFTYAFRPQCWYFIGLEHTCRQSLIGKAESEIKLYVDGNLHERRPFDFPRISKPLAFCCIGTNPLPTMAGLQRRRRQCPLFAEVGPIYIFKEPIGSERMSRLASRGGDVLPSFGSAAGLPWLATNDHMRTLAQASSLLDAEIGGSLHLLYHPALLNGRSCPDASPSGATGTFRRPAEILGQVHVASRIRPLESLWAIAYGGSLCLLPLTVCDVQKDSLAPLQGNSPLSQATAKLSASIFRIISLAVQHPGNNDELCRMQGPEILSIILHCLLQTTSSMDTGKQNGQRDEELVAAIVSLCQSPKNNYPLKVQLFSTLLLDLTAWSSCHYGLQKKLLSSLADMVFTESAAMREANAFQMLLDYCRRCYWVVREVDSIDTFLTQEGPRPVGEVNALVDELLVVIELLIGAAPPSLATDDIQRLIRFLVDCPQPNQVSRVLHLIYRLVVQPNSSRAQTFSKPFISCGGIELLLVLLQREAKAGNNPSEPLINKGTEYVSSQAPAVENNMGDELGFHGKKESVAQVESSLYQNDKGTIIKRTTSHSEISSMKNLGGISFSISSDNARNNIYNIDNGDGVIVGIINLLGALVTSGHLKFASKDSTPGLPSNILVNGLHHEGTCASGDKVSLLLFALQKAFQAAPQRLMTGNVYMALLAAAINVSSTDDGHNLYDSDHRFEHLHLLSVLLRSLSYSSPVFQVRAIQDLLFLACSHPENRSILTSMEEWPEWILEVLISNYEMSSSKYSNEANLETIEDLVHNFLIIVLEHSMRQKDGWKDVEAAIHCAEWLSMVGGSSTGDQRVRREESLPLFKRKLLGGLLDFAARELQAQTQVIAAAAAGVAAEGLSPEDAKAETQFAAHLSVALAENAIVILMLVEDHLRLQSQQVLKSIDGSGSPQSFVSSVGNHLNSVTRAMDNSLETTISRKSPPPSDSGGLSLDILSSMADANGQLSAAVMERLTAAAAAEPYESVRCAFVSYGSCASDLREGWKYRSRLWYGVGLPSVNMTFGGGGSGWESWNSILEKDVDGNWVELPLIKKSVIMLQALLLDECCLGGGLGIGGGSGTGMGGMSGLYQLLDSDQPFLCMLRMVLIAMREEDYGVDSIFVRNADTEGTMLEGLHGQPRNSNSLDSPQLSTWRPFSTLLWSVLAPILNMPISESRRQRVFVASCILYSEVWHAVGGDRKIIRKRYLETILPPFISILRRWRPLLVGIHEFTSPDGLNPLILDDRVLATDALPIESALSMISSGWASAFASPPAAMALAMIAAGAGGEETLQPPIKTQLPLRRESSLLERKSNKLHAFSSFHKPPNVTNKTPIIPKDKAAARAAALATARDLERNAKIGSGRGLSAVAMATSAQRRNASDLNRVQRWNVSEAMGIAWMECLQSVTKSVPGKDFSVLSNNYVAILVDSFAFARNMQRIEVDRRAQVDVMNKHRASNGIRAWRKLLHCLSEIDSLFAIFGAHLCTPQHILWKLDVTEGSTRMRRCLRRDYNGSDHIGAAANYEDTLSQVKSMGKDTKYHEDEQDLSLTDGLPSASILMAEVSIEEGNDEYDQIEVNDAEKEASNTEQSRNKVPSVSTEQIVGSQLRTVDVNISSDHDLLPSTPVIGSGCIPNELDERIILEISSSMVRPLWVVRGTFQVTTKRINFIVEDHVDDESRDAAHPYKEQTKDRSWIISSLHQIFSRRYLLRRSALELFMIDRSNFFFDFESIEGRKKAYRAIVQARPPNLNNIYLASQRPEQLLKRTQLMESWARWEISNFEYLMQLNTLAGRSYNDITQYPVFPWILADYTSQHLDFNNPSSYRDLSKPIGALNVARLEKFKERYHSFDDPLIPKFHYGSHYSNAGIVLYYLVRVEPFTTLAIQLQGGKFDHADRMFSDIGATWSGVLEDMSDVKELVPELFYLPEVLTNVNSVDFGTTQLGEKLDTVKLPPWANNPIDFIHKHRMALESEYVSAHLHEWIDLIFGYKQRGREAIVANNIFFYITYEGTVDIDKISDPVQRHATQDQIAYFGQTPSQLLTIPHMKRRSLSDILHLQTIFRNPTEIRPYIIPNQERCNVPASAIFASSDFVIVVDEHVPSAHVALHKWQPNTPDGHGMPFLFQHGKVMASSSGGAFMRMFKGPTGSGSENWQFPQAFAFATSGIRSSAIVAVCCDKEIITGGHVDNNVKLISSDGAKTLETAWGHSAPITCLALSSDNKYLVTGSRDTTAILWRMHSSHSNRMPEHSTISPPVPTSSPRSSSGPHGIIDSGRGHRIEGPIHILRGHFKEVTCCSINSDIGIVVSCSTVLLIHSIRRNRLIRRLEVEAHSVCLSSEGVLLTWNKYEKKLCTFNINGSPIATSILSPFAGSVSCINVSVDGQSVIIGLSSRENIGGENTDTETGKIENVDPLSPTDVVNANRLAVPVPSTCFLDMHTLKLLHTLELQQGQDITTFALNQDNTNLLVSTADKQLIVFTDPALSLKVVDQMLRLGWEGDGFTHLIR